MMPNCIQCGGSFVRKHPSQKFCPKRGGRHICKDRYHNRRRFRSGEISAARQAYLGISGYATPDHNGVIDDTHPFSCEGLGQW